MLTLFITILYSFLFPSLQPSYICLVSSPDKISFHYQYPKGGDNISTLEKLIQSDSTITFAMNGSMFTTPDYEPVGLYIEDGRVYSETEIYNNSKVNFGISPQAVFFIDKKGHAGMVKAARAAIKDYRYAVELAPFLVINGQINSRVAGMNGSKFIRNAIGVNKAGHVLFVISTHRVTMEQLANKMKSLGCINAAYVDGGVSESWQKGETFARYPGQFAVLAAIHK